MQNQLHYGEYRCHGSPELSPILESNFVAGQGWAN